MYEITLEALKSANNERLWFNTNLKLAKLYLDSKKIADVENIIDVLKRSCQHTNGPDPSKGSYLLEVYCLEIQLCSVTQNSARMRQIYPKTINLNATVSDPRITGIIREEGGKMRMSESNWELAYNEFFEAFKSYQEAGNARARDCLKYVVLASMLVRLGFLFSLSFSLFLYLLFIHISKYLIYIESGLKRYQYFCWTRSKGIFR